MVDDGPRNIPVFNTGIYQQRLEDIAPFIASELDRIDALARPMLNNRGATFLTEGVIGTILRGLQLMSGITSAPTTASIPDVSDIVAVMNAPIQADSKRLLLMFELPSEYSKTKQRLGRYNFVDMHLLYQTLDDKYPGLEIGIRVVAPYSMAYVGSEDDDARHVAIVEVSIEPRQQPAHAQDGAETFTHVATEDDMILWKQQDQFDKYKDNLTEHLAEYGCRNDGGRPIQVKISNVPYEHGKYMYLHDCSSVTPRIAACISMAWDTRVHPSKVTAGVPIKDSFSQYCERVNSDADTVRDEYVYITVDD